MSTAILSILSGIAGMFGWGIYDFLGGVYAKQIGPFKSFFWSQLAGLIFALLLIFAFTINLNVPILAIILLPIAAIVYSAGYLLFYPRHDRCGFSRARLAGDERSVDH